MTPSLQQAMADALRELAQARRAFRAAMTANAHAGDDGFPLNAFHRLQDANETVRELACALYPEGS